MVVLSLRCARVAVRQQRRMLKRRRSRGRAMQDSKKRVAPKIPTEVEVEKNRVIRMQDSENWVAPEIPLDLLIAILARLPAKSVMRFKCVSKFWLSLLCSKYFCNRFLMFPSPSQPRLYLSLVDFLQYHKSVILSSNPSTCGSSLVFDQDLNIPKMGGYDLRLIHGFITFTYFLKSRIYNPSTRQFVMIPVIQESDIMAEERDLENDPYAIQYYMGHDPVSDQYKLLCTIMAEDMGIKRSEYWVFVIEAGGSWKRKSVAKDFHPHLPNLLELYMDGAIYYLAWTETFTCVLVRFDVRSEELSMIQLPHKAGDVKLARLDRRMSQINYGGKVAVFDMTYLKEKGTVDLWVVEDWKKREWLRKTLVLKPWQMHLVITKSLIPKGTHLKGKVILVPQFLVSPFYILCYDLQTNDLKRLEIEGIPKRWFSLELKYFDVDFMHPSESIRYLET